MNIEFYGAPSTGSFTLGQGADGNYSTCDHCLLALGDVAGGSASNVFFATSGTMAVTTADSGDGKSAGTITNATLVEVLINQQSGKSTPIAGGACVTIASASWDTTQLRESAVRHQPPSDDLPLAGCRHQLARRALTAFGWAPLRWRMADGR